MNNDELKKSGIEEAVAKAGGREQLAELVGVTREAVRLWLLQGFVPANKGRVLDVEAKTGVPRTRLNPSIYPS